MSPTSPLQHGQGHPLFALQHKLGNAATGQLLASLADEPARPAHPRAADELGGTPARLPELARIQASFGRHDVTGVLAHTGAAASEAARRIGASAYTVGRHVVFGETPDLHTAAHEAAHAIQQGGGLQPGGGFGRAGDRSEREADAVADAVVQGRSAERLLDGVAGGHVAGAQQPATVQRQTAPATPAKRPYWVEFDKGGRTWNGSEILKNLDIQDPSIPRGLSIEWKSGVEETMANAIIAGPAAVVKLCHTLRGRIEKFQAEVAAMTWAPPPGIPDAAGCQEAWKVVNRIMIDTAFGGARATLTYDDLDRIAGYLHLFGRSLAADTSNPTLVGAATWHQVPKGELFVGEPSVADVRQGSGLGDCFFMSALASVVDHDPALIKRNIKLAGKEGDKRFYWVLLYRPAGGSSRAAGMIEAPQLIDEQIATTSLLGHDTGDPIFGHSNETAGIKVVEAPANLVTDPLAPGYDSIAAQQKTGPQPDLDTRELWPSLYEKAYAKLRGGYGKIDGGIGDEALAALTGKPAELSNSIFSDEGLMTESGPGHELWAKLWRVVQEEKRPVTAGTWQEQKRPALFAAGTAPVSSGHAYSVERVSGKPDDPSTWTVHLRDPRGDRVSKERLTIGFAEFRQYFSRFMWTGK